MRDVDWFEDFFGKDLPRGWELSTDRGTLPNGQPGPVPVSRPYGNTVGGTQSGGIPGGVWVLGLFGGSSAQNPGCAQVIRLRFGGALPWSSVDARHFSPYKNLHFECRLFLSVTNNTDTRFSATVGLTGRDDPDQVLAALAGAPASGWVLQARNIPIGGSETPQNCENVATQWHNTPGAWFLIEIDTVWATRTATLAINGDVLATVTGDMVTPESLCAELQLWNREVNGIYTAPVMYVDAIGCKQGR